MNKYIKRQMQNFAILLLIIIGLKNLLSVLPFRFVNEFNEFYTHVINPNPIVIHGALSFMFGMLIILLAVRLYKRIRNAWIIEIIALSATLVLQLVHFHKYTIHIVIIEVFVLVILSLSYKDFCRRSNRVTVKLALIFIAVSFLILLTNAAVGLYVMKANFKDVKNIFDAVGNSVTLLVFMDTSVLKISGKFGRIYADYLISVNWICIILSAIFLLKPLVYNHFEDKYDKEKAHKIVLKHGQNPMSYLTMENDKKYFFSNIVEGVCSYTVVGNVFVCCGDIICAHEDGFAFLSELMAFCKQNGWDILMLNVTDYFLELYKSAEFGVVKFGEDACFKLSDYNLAGGKVAKVRAAINHANNANITVNEYVPNKGRDFQIEEEIQEISDEWLKDKNGNEMAFMLGFIVLLPYLNCKAYLVDITRRRSDAPQGVLEKTVYEAFMVLKEEGVEWANMGLSPLYNVANGDKVALTEKLFAYIYDNLNNAYGFKSLHHAKEKYAPTQWQTRYLVYNSKPFTPQYAYAIVKAQNPKGITNIINSQILKK